TGATGPSGQQAALPALVRYRATTGRRDGQSPGSQAGRLRRPAGARRGCPVHAGSPVPAQPVVTHARKKPLLNTPYSLAIRCPAVIERLFGDPSTERSILVKRTQTLPRSAPICACLHLPADCL